MAKLRILMMPQEGISLRVTRKHSRAHKLKTRQEDSTHFGFKYGCWDRGMCSSVLTIAVESHCSLNTFYNQVWRLSRVYALSELIYLLSLSRRNSFVDKTVQWVVRDIVQVWGWEEGVGKAELKVTQVSALIKRSLLVLTFLVVVLLRKASNPWFC